MVASIRRHMLKKGGMIRFEGERAPGGEFERLRHGSGMRCEAQTTALAFDYSQEQIPLSWIAGKKLAGYR
jgi:hypothetical protein